MKNLRSVFSLKIDLEFTSDELQLIRDIFNKRKDKDIYKSDFKDIEIKYPHSSNLSQKLFNFAENIQNYLHSNYSVETKVGNYGLRNVNGRVVQPEGHIHLIDDVYFTSITTIYGDGPWYEFGGKRYTSKEGETTFFAEKMLVEKFPNLNLKQVLHGSPQGSKERLIFLCSFLPLNS